MKAKAKKVVKTKKATKAKPKAKVAVTPEPKKPTLEKVNLISLGGKVSEYALPLTLGALRAKVDGAEHLQALVNGEPENSDSLALMDEDTVSFTGKVKGN